MNINISKWHGRLGNNITQVIHAIQIGIHFNYNVILPSHSFFNTTYIIINPYINIDAPLISVPNNFYYREQCNVDLTIFNNNIKQSIQLLKSIILLPNAKQLPINDLVIYIRSGDLFLNKNPHSDYITPPFSYYTSIIKKNKFNHIYIVTEDLNNPCTNALLYHYPYIQYKKQSLEKDIQLLLSATNVVESYGTFTPTLLMLSNHIKNIYRPHYQLNIYNPYLSHIHFHETNLSLYIILMGNWNNHITQQLLMLFYPATH